MMHSSSTLTQQAAMAALVGLLFAGSALAQPDRIRMSEAGLNASPLLEVPVETWSSVDLRGLDARQWKALASMHADLLDAREPETRELAMRNIIHFTANYGDYVDFSRAAGRLYQIYRFDRDEAHRIYALAALHGIRDDHVMQLLVQHLPRETSPRVRRTLEAVIAAYYADRPS